VVSVRPHASCLSLCWLHFTVGDCELHVTMRITNNRINEWDKTNASETKDKAVPLHAMEALGGRGGVAPTHSRPRH